MNNNTLHRSRAWLWGWYLVFRGSDTSGNYQHKGRKGKKGGSLPGGGHGAIGIASDASKDQKRQAIDQHHAARAEESGRLGPLLRKRLIREHAIIQDKMIQVQAEADAAWIEVKQQQDIINNAIRMKKFARESGMPENVVNSWNSLIKEKSDSRDEILARVQTLNNEKWELSVAQSELSVNLLAVPKDRQATVSMKTSIRKGRESAQKGLDVFNQLVGTGTVNGMRVPVKRTTDDRAYHLNGSVHLAQTSSAMTMLHEMGHFLEFHDPKVHKKAVAFRDRRTRGESIQKLADIYPKARYKDYEVCKPDRFQSAYVGKVYGHANSEIISMGLQYMYQDAVGFAKRDPGFFDFMIEVLRGG